MPSTCSPSNAAPHRSFLRRHRWLCVYLLLLLASHITQQLFFPPLKTSMLTDEPVLSATIPAFTRAGPLDDTTTQLAYLYQPAWPNTNGSRAARTHAHDTPVILIHGSPGAAWNWNATLPHIAREGFDVYALDMPGFGNSTNASNDYSTKAQARATLAFMDELGIDRAHVVGWSNGGSVALYMAQLAQPRLASLTLLAALGAQETEGSGSYAFEHFKYTVSHIFFAYIAEAIPHFGALGNRRDRVSFTRSFLDSDQRPLADVMRNLSVPSLILHGRRDFLIGDWAAERHHEMMPTSSLVMLDASHFLPWQQRDQTLDTLTTFFDRHDAPGVQPLRTYTNLAPEHPPLLGVVSSSIVEFLLETPWWVHIVIIALLAACSRAWTIGLLGLLVPVYYIDFVVAYLGLITGLALRQLIVSMIISRPRPQRSVVKTVAVVVGRGAKNALVFVVGVTVCYMFAQPPVHDTGLLGTVVGVGAGAWAVWFVDNLITLLVRGRVRIAWARARNHEFWPAWLMYLPLVPVVFWLSIRYRHPLVFTCANPGIPNGGGVLGEPKDEILSKLMAVCDATLAGFVIKSNKVLESRVQEAKRIMGVTESVRTFPVVCKPNAGERGRAVRVVRSEDDLRRYLELVDEDVILQQFHEGPGEVGILWMRRPEAETGGRAGHVFSITKKVFPVVVGDGKRTLRQLIRANRRFVAQWDVLSERHADRLDDVVPAGERVRLAQAGNHAQGTMFVDGAELITPELEEAIDAVARGFDGGLDYARFDVRYRSEEELTSGKWGEGGVGIVELNGTLGESTNIYDPQRSVLWAWGVLIRQWAELYRLGAWRRGQGRRPVGVLTMAGMVLGFAKRPTGGRVAD